MKVSEWLKVLLVDSRGASNTWKGLVASLNLIRKSLVWKVGNGLSLKLGLDPWVGRGYYYKLT